MKRPAEVRTQPLFTLGDILRATGGELIARSALDAVDSVVIDSREAVSGALFVPLAGERTDGHFFIPEALGKGCPLILVDRRYAEESKEKFLPAAKNVEAGVVCVPSTLRALQDLARYHMRRVSNVVRVGITGSAGKTTTKEIVGAILLQHAPGFMNKGNLNSEIGLPLSTFGVKEHDRYAIFEMGMNHQGEMDVLVDIVGPDVAAITNIGTAHIGLLGSQDAIAAEKKKIFARFDGRQTGFVFEDERYLDFLSAGVNGAIRTYGPRSTPGFEKSFDLGVEGFDLTYRGRSARLSLAGMHNLNNALCGISIAELLGVPAADVVAGLRSVRPLSGRGEILRGRITIIQDSYNANPEAFAKAVDLLDGLPWEGRKIIVAGSMKELGPATESAHASVGELLAGSTADALFLFGDEAKAAYERCAGSKPVVRWTSDFDELVRAVTSFVSDGDLVLLKGSRGVELERLVPFMTDSPKTVRDGD